MLAYHWGFTIDGQISTGIASTSRNCSEAWLIKTEFLFPDPKLTPQNNKEVSWADAPRTDSWLHTFKPRT
jgi:hypothetical protein